MAIHRPTYATASHVKSATDIATDGRLRDQHVDKRAGVRGLTRWNSLCSAGHRRFLQHSWPRTCGTGPTSSGPYPWRIWLQQHELADVTGHGPGFVTTGGKTDPLHRVEVGAVGIGRGRRTCSWRSTGPPASRFGGRLDNRSRTCRSSACTANWNKTRPAGNPRGRDSQHHRDLVARCRTARWSTRAT